ncbi:hypothetical protein BH09ACT10_BH09ACT10_18240 [soil metagenome]
MDETISTIGVVEDSYVVSDEERAGWFRRRQVDRTITYLDWAINGLPLREHLKYVDGSSPGEVTVLQNDWAAPGVGRQLIETLLGKESSSNYDVAMPDRRVAVLFCAYCFDLDCATVTAVIVFSNDVVEWRDVGWQVSYESLDLSDGEFDPPTFRFDRAQYVAELERLLELELSRVSEEAQ